MATRCAPPRAAWSRWRRTEPSALSAPRRVIGLDFSGARDCGRRIWLAEGGPSRRGFRIDRIATAAERLGTGVDPAAVFPALRRRLAAAHDAAIGADVPVALCRALTGPDWGVFVAGFAARFADAEAFRLWCAGLVDERSARRATDIEARTPFAAHNLRLYRQTWSALAHLVGPLVAAGALAVPPLSAPLPDRPWLLETCPASALRHLGIRAPYKGRGETLRGTRAAILEALVARRWIAPPAAPIRAAVLGDAGGDALDAAIAGAIAARAVADPANLAPRDPLERIEGRVYFT